MQHCALKRFYSSFVASVSAQILSLVLDIYKRHNHEPENQQRELKILTENVLYSEKHIGLGPRGNSVTSINGCQCTHVLNQINWLRVDAKHPKFKYSLF